MRVEVLPLVRVDELLFVLRVEVLPEERVPELSRLTLVVRPDASVVLTVVRVVPLLLTFVSTVVDG